MDPFNTNITDNTTAQQGEQSSLDYKRILYRVINYWYIVVLSLAIAVFIAFLRNRYATRIYPITTSIIIREAQETSEGKILYNNPLVTGYRNYLNEPYILRSYPLIESVLEELNFMVTFYREGNLLTSDVYDIIPVEAFVIGREASAAEFIFRILNEQTYELRVIRPSKDDLRQQFHFGDTINFGGISLMARLRSDRDYKPYVDEPFIMAYRPASSLAREYVNKLSVSWAESGSGVMNLAVSGPYPQKDKDFLAGLIKKYQEYDLDKKNETATRTIKFIEEQLTDIADSLNVAERQLEAFKNKNVFTDLGAEALRIYQKLEGLEAQKAELIIRKNYYDYLVKYINSSNQLDQVILPSSVGITDGILVELVSRMIDIQMEMKLYLRNKAPNPVLEGRQRQLTELKKNIVESVDNQQSTDKIKLDYLNKQITDAEKQLNYLPVAERQFVSIQRNYSLLENLYLFLLQKRAEAGISKASTSSDIVIVNPPMQSGGFVTPKIPQNYLIAVLLGLAIPVVSFVLLEIFNARVQSKEDVEKICTIPFIGGIGHKQSENNLVVHTRPKSAVAESFRALRSNMNFFTANQDKKVFMVTSSISGEGKTFTTINLATVLAMSNKKTVIVGADMRKPRIFTDFDLRNEVGLSSYLSELSSLEEAIQQTSIPNLFLISGGPVPPNPSELLLKPRMEEMLKGLLQKFDFVILDTPPVALVTDAFVLSKFADHTLFLVRQNYTPKQVLYTIQDYYQNERIRNISILLNDIFKSGPGYGYGYHYGYGYGHTYSYGTGHGYYEDDGTSKRPSFLRRIFRKRES